MMFSRIDTIFLPSDFSDTSRVAFEHALKLAIILGAELRVMHVADKSNVDWADFPGVRATLERWQLLPPGRSPVSVGRLGIRVEKIVARHDDPVKACVQELERHPAELMVLATHQHAGRMAWMRQSVAGPLARAAKTMTLFLPEGSPGFVDTATGSMNLHSVLIPVAVQPPAAPAVDAVRSLTRMLGPGAGTVTTLHVGDGEAQPAAAAVETGNWTWNQINRDGAPVEKIRDVVQEVHADLIAMTTQGRHGFLDLLRGSTTERVLRGAACPVLAVPLHEA